MRRSTVLSLPLQLVFPDPARKNSAAAKPPADFDVGDEERFMVSAPVLAGAGGEENADQKSML